MNRFVLIPAAVILLFGCQKGTEEAPSGPTILTASSSQVAPDSKVGIDEETATTCTWSENDKISVFTSEGSFETFTLSSGAGEKTGKFAANLESGVTVADYAIYPAGAHSYTGGVLKINMPDRYTFDEGVSNIPMVATVDESLLLNFKHCGGVIRFGIRNLTVKGTFIFTCRTHRVTGDFDVVFSDGLPMMEAVEDEKGSVVSISFEKPVAEENLYYFYVPVPAGSYTDFSIEIRDESGAVVMTKSAANNKNVVGRGTVLKMKTLVQPEFTGGNEGTE